MTIDNAAILDAAMDDYDRRIAEEDPMAAMERRVFILERRVRALENELDAAREAREILRRRTRYLEGVSASGDEWQPSETARRIVNEISF